MPKCGVKNLIEGNAESDATFVSEPKKGSIVRTCIRTIENNVYRGEMFRFCGKRAKREYGAKPPNVVQKLSKHYSPAPLLMSNKRQ